MSKMDSDSSEDDIPMIGGEDFLRASDGDGLGRVTPMDDSGSGVDDSGDDVPEGGGLHGPHAAHQGNYIFSFFQIKFGCFIIFIFLKVFCMRWMEQVVAGYWIVMVVELLAGLPEL